MLMKESKSYPIQIFMAGDSYDAREFCQYYCDKEGLCVTVTPTSYVYTNDSEGGFIVGLINYPRFPKNPDELFLIAQLLGYKLREYMNQESFSIQTPDKTYWYSWRKEDN